MHSTVIKTCFILYCTGKERPEQHVLTMICSQSWSILLPIFLLYLLLESATLLPCQALGGGI